MSPAVAAGLAALLPGVAAVLVLATGRRPNLREAVGVVVGALTLALVAGRVLPAVLAGERPRLALGEPVPGLELALEVEPLGLVFALVASSLWIVTTLYAAGYLRAHGEGHQTRFFACFAVAISGALGVAFAANLVTLFVFYELITVSTWPLVTHTGTAEARRAGRAYLGYLMGTSVVLLLLAIAWTWHSAGTTAFVPGGILEGRVDPSLLPLLLALFAFGAGKAALVPLHRWLPAAMVAPTPVSALLHAVAVVKAGVFTIVKVCVYVFGLDVLRETGASTWLAWVAAGTILFASTVALTKDNLKARLAYSTISQLAYVTLGAAIATPVAAAGAGAHVVMHAFAKITLFFCAGAIYVASHEKEVSRMDGLGRVMPWTYAGFLVGSLGVIGLPPTGGAWSKWLLAAGAADTGQLALVAVLMLSSLLSIGYLVPVFVRGVFRPRPAGAAPSGEAPLLCVAPLVVTAAGCLVLFVAAGPLADLLGGAVTP